MKYVFNVIKSIKSNLNRYKIIVTKSTVPVTTGDKITKILKSNKNKNKFDVVSNPEFLREGSAINDAQNPDRIVIGYADEIAKKTLIDLYEPYKCTKLECIPRTAELIKYASNAFLAVKISYINQMADLCEKVGANIDDIAKGMGLDKRIGNKFLHTGPGYGGSCFPKDTLALVKTANQFKSEVSIIEETIKYNDLRKA